jgi:hypothetical protein
MVLAFKLKAGVGGCVDLPGKAVVLQRQGLQHVEVGLDPEGQAEKNGLKGLSHEIGVLVRDPLLVSIAFV